MQGGAFRLPNGNTIITDCDDALMFEVTYNNEVVWSHTQGSGQSFIARAQKISYYLGINFCCSLECNFDRALDIFIVYIFQI